MCQIKPINIDYSEGTICSMHGWLSLCMSCRHLIDNHPKIWDRDIPQTAWVLKAFHIQEGDSCYPAAVIIANAEHIRLCDECASKWKEIPSLFFRLNPEMPQIDDPLYLPVWSE